MKINRIFFRQKFNSISGTLVPITVKGQGGGDIHLMRGLIAEFKRAGCSAGCIIASAAFVGCFRPAPPLEEGDDRLSGLTEETSPDGDTTTQGHPLLKKRQATKAVSLPTQSTSSTPTTSTTAPATQTPTTGSGIPNDTSPTTIPGLSLSTTIVSGLKPTIAGSCDINAAAHAASTSTGKVQSVTCNGNGELSILIHLPAGSSAFNLSVAAAYADGTNDVRTQTIQRTPFLCPAGYVGVPGSGIQGLGNASASKGNTNWWLDIDRDFCVMKYPAKNSNASTYATSTAAGTPWVSIPRGIDETTAGSAFKACKDAGTSFRLISNTQWQTVARNAENIADNWSGGGVGVGSMARGHTDSSPFGTLTNTTDDNDGYYGTGNSSSQAVDSGWEQRRTQVISNGEVLWDFGGNILQSVSDNLSDLGVNPALGISEYSWTSSFPITGPLSQVNRKLFAPAGPYSKPQNIGIMFGGSGGAVSRGGWFGVGNLSGLYAASLDMDAAASGSFIGFRCAYLP